MTVCSGIKEAEFLIVSVGLHKKLWVLHQP